MIWRILKDLRRTDNENAEKDLLLTIHGTIKSSIKTHSIIILRLSKSPRGFYSSFTNSGLQCPMVEIPSQKIFRTLEGRTDVGTEATVP